MRNRYTGEREQPTIVPCPVPVMKGSLNLEALIESVDGVRMEDIVDKIPSFVGKEIEINRIYICSF